MSWTSPAELKEQLHRLWARGVPLQAKIAASNQSAESPLENQQDRAKADKFFPRRLVLKAPGPKDLAHRLMEVQAWSQSLAEIKGLRLKYRTVRNRVSGTNDIPCECWIDSPEDLCRTIGKTFELQRFVQIVEFTRDAHPDLLPWVQEKPLRAVENADHWPQLMAVVQWLLDNPRPGIYLRTLDLPGIHSKFVEAHRSLLAELFDQLLPDEAIDRDATGIGGFARRYGFLEKPTRLRFRVVDPQVNPLFLDPTGLLSPGFSSDLTLDVHSLASLGTLPQKVFITENEANFLAFPPCPGAWVFFGAGYGFSALRAIPWLLDRPIYYWGDIDTHGFAMVSQLRTVLPHAQTILMDRQTFLDHREFWVTEDDPISRPLPLLTEEESALYADLVAHRLGHRLRLEQEFVRYSEVERAIENILSKPRQT